MTNLERANHIYNLFMESQAWDQDALRELQESQLEQLLRHARAEVPFYAKRLDSVFHPSGEINWDRWQDIPILSRLEAAQSFSAMQARSLPPGHGPVSSDSTSGSTGLPLTVNYTRMLGEACLAADWRGHGWWQLDWSKTQVQLHKLSAAQVAEGPHHDHGPWGPADAALGKSYAANVDTPLSDFFQHLRDVGADYLFGQGSNMLAAALALQERGERVPLAAVCSHGVTIEDEYAPAMQAGFGARLNAMYSSKEAGRIAHSCTSCSHYHVNAESVLVEILRDDGSPSPPGESGRVVVTPFFNTVQPFIRYEQGDMAAWAVDNSCHIKLPTLSRVDGRIYHLFRYRNGTRFMPLVPDTSRRHLGAAFWQIAQVSADTIEVRYKPDATWQAALEGEFAGHLRDLLKDDFAVRFIHIDELPLTPSGKFLKYANEIDDT